jgi:uncharacterized repeat protein (TIGR02543 family)
MDSTAILNAVISIVSLILTGLIIPWLLAKLGTEKVKQGATKFDSWTAMAEKVVDAAYQMFTANDERKTFAVNALKALGVPESTIETLIEAAVKTCKVAGTAIDAVKTVEVATDAVIEPVASVSVATTPLYALSYDGNGAASGTAPMVGMLSSYAAGVSVIISDNVGALAKDGYIFGGWNTSADGTGTAVAVGAALTIGAANVTLYAVWVAAQVAA